MSTSLIISMLAGGLLLAGQPLDQAPRAPKKPTTPVISCELLTERAPRGGRLEVEGRGFGRTPLVRIAGKVARILERSGDKIAAQIPRDSNGGRVTVRSGEDEVECGTLIITGKN